MAPRELCRRKITAESSVARSLSVRDVLIRRGIFDAIAPFVLNTSVRAQGRE
jgi:hypothetical protein